MPSLISLASLNLMLVVILGAFGAHGLKDRVDALALSWWQTGVNYHAIHGLGLFGIALLLMHIPEHHSAKTAAGLLQIGIVIFCGSLYAMTLGAPRWFGAITPIGGLAFIAGWAVLAWACWQLKS